MNEEIIANEPESHLYNLALFNLVIRDSKLQSGKWKAFIAAETSGSSKGAVPRSTGPDGNT